MDLRLPEPDLWAWLKQLPTHSVLDVRREHRAWIARVLIAGTDTEIRGEGDSPEIALGEVRARFERMAPRPVSN